MAKCFSVSYNNIDKRIDPEFYNPFTIWKSGIDFERYALSLIDALAKNEKKDFFANYKLKKDHRQVEIDGYAPNGLGEIDGPLVIEVKWDIKSLYDIKRLIDRINKFQNIKTLLLITNEQKFFDLNRFDIDVILWDYKALKELEDRFPQVSYPFTKDINGAISQWQNMYYDTNRKSLVREIAINNNLVLFLGAGCSIDDNIPNWNNLLENLLFEIFDQSIYDGETLTKLEKLNNIDKDDKEFGKIKNRLYNSNLTVGRFIKETFDKRFIEQTQKSLYTDYTREINEQSTLNVIVDFIANNKSNVEAIVTYNFDDLLEFYLEERKIKYKSIHEGGKSPDDDQIPIYHVHGYLPKDITVKNNNIIFGEKEYHIQYGDPHSWQNMIPLNFLRENTILFVGLSMDDPNLRRILDIGYRYFNSPKHYLFYSKNRWESSDEKISNIFRGMEEHTFRDLGLKIIWLNDHKELDYVLNEITLNIKKHI